MRKGGASAPPFKFLTSSDEPELGPNGYVCSVAMTDFKTHPRAIDAHPEDGLTSRIFPTLPGCQTWGDNYEAAVRNAEEALAVYIETLIANGDPIPKAEMSASPTSLGIIVRTFGRT
jgi:predicted RNase H-like HicB family nuclease